MFAHKSAAKNKTKPLLLETLFKVDAATGTKKYNSNKVTFPTLDNPNASILPIEYGTNTKKNKMPIRATLWVRNGF
jgi:hypothetical protein